MNFKNFKTFAILFIACINFIQADTSLFDGSQKLSGVKISLDPEKADNKVAFWENAPKGFRISLLNKQTDLSKYKALSIRFYSKAADKHSFTILVDSNGDTKGNYFSKTINIDWQGWKTLVIPFEDFYVTRKVVGWNKVDKILLANNGYGAGKANKDAVYYIDDIKALTKAPEQAALKKDEVVQLSSIKSSYSHGFNTEPTKEEIYGIRFEVKGQPGTEVKIDSFKVYDQNLGFKEKMEYINLKKKITSTEWESGRIEILVKKGTALVKSKISVIGKNPVELRNIESFKGGFPDDPPMKEAPYLDWINSLKVNFDNAKNSPLLEFGKDGCQIWEHKEGRLVYLPDSKFKRFKDNTAPFMKLSVKKLIEIVPTKRPFNYSGGYKGSRYTWEPEKSDTIYDAKTKKPYKPEKEFPIHGYEEVTAPSGKKIKYAYHDTDKSHAIYKGKRIYVERFQNDAKLELLTQIGIQLGMLYRRTGEMKYGVRSAAILWSIAKNMPDWPVHGKDSWNAPKSTIKLQAPDFYSWFSFVLSGDWYVTSAGSLLYPCRYYAILDEPAVWDALAQETQEENPRLETANGFLHIAKMILKRDAFYRNSKFVMFHNLSGSANRSLLQLGRMLGEPEIVHYTLRKILGSFKEVFMVDGVFPESQWYTLDQLVRQSEALGILTDYNDPDGYVSPLDNMHLNITDPKESIPTYKVAIEALKRQTFPDGTAYTIHDSWSETANPVKGKPSVMQFPERTKASPYLFRSYGHGVLGRGENQNKIEAQLHYSGTYNHAHKDMLNLNFWAYGDELLSDIGYSHITAYNGSSVSHNLVVVNRSAQKNGHKGSLLSWSSRKGSTQIIQSDQGATPAYPECSIYRRALVLLP
ncbi:MAG: heparinase II/III-family protein, partial [Lentisphaeraceae bacterium]|nr:heparinase II/III-family protein [Lentisphaeraceae bacterium]